MTPAGLGGPMNILGIIINRRSVRDFKEQEIPQDVLNGLTEYIRWAPSEGNMQSRKLYFVFDQVIKAKLAKATLNQNFLVKAPLVIVACLDRNISVRYGERGVNIYSIQDVSASIMNLMLTPWGWNRMDWCIQ
jgi:nitroreductase